MFQTVDKLEKFERLPTVFLFYNNIKPLISTMGSLTQSGISFCFKQPLHIVLNGSIKFDPFDLIYSS